MSEELELSQSTDVSEESSSESHSDKAEKSSESTESPSTAPAEAKEKYVPYDRFQEIVQQKNEFLKRLEDNEKRYQELHNRFNSSQKPAEVTKTKDQQLIERLKGVDQEFGAWAEQQEAARQKLEQTIQRQEAETAERAKAQVSSTLEQLHTEYKVSKDVQELYKTMIRAKAQENPNLGVQDLGKVYKEVHENINKFLEGYKRTVLSSYTTAKKADSAVPASQKGSAPKATTSKPKYAVDREEALAQVVARAMAQSRANNDV